MLKQVEQVKPSRLQIVIATCSLFTADYRMCKLNEAGTVRTISDSEFRFNTTSDREIILTRMVGAASADNDKEYPK
jgi:hypothetical protein